MRPARLTRTAVRPGRQARPALYQLQRPSAALPAPTYCTNHPRASRNYSASPLPHHTQPILSPYRPKRIVIGITGATGTLYAIRILQILRALQVETHLVISKWALATMKYETSLTEAQIRAMASVCYTAKDLSAPIASGSFQHDGMMIVPCSMKTLSAVRTGFCDDLISRAADVSLKENRKLVMAVRETPLNDIHLENMLFLRRAGACIFPPVPSFYNRPETLEDMVDQTAGRMLDQMGIVTEGFERWEGFRWNKKVEEERPKAAVGYS